MFLPHVQYIWKSLDFEFGEVVQCGASLKVIGLVHWVLGTQISFAENTLSILKYHILLTVHLLQLLEDVPLQSRRHLWYGNMASQSMVLECLCSCWWLFI